MKQSPMTLVDRLLAERGSKGQLDRDHLWQAITGALDGRRLIDNLAETLRISASETEEILVAEGFGDIVANARINTAGQRLEGGVPKTFAIASSEADEAVFREYFEIEFRPPLEGGVSLDAKQHEAVVLLMRSITASMGTDPFPALYRENVLEYHDEFIAREGKAIHAFVERHFGSGGQKLRYLVNSGIGANEQFNHVVASINNANPGRRMLWIIADSSRHLYDLPPDASVDNTLFMEFSRSGKTEETVKLHEFTPEGAVRIVFANSGPLRALGERDAASNLRLDLPDQVSGRFGRNKTPILLAPMLVAGLDTRQHWAVAERVIAATNICSTGCIPAQLGQFIYLHQLRNSVNHIYLACNDDLLLRSSDELLQFWNEGVNKGGNDILMSRGLGMLRDSHASIEGVLGNAATKLSIFVLAHSSRRGSLPPLALEQCSPINPEHIGLKFGDEERILAQANYEHMSRVMPCVRIQATGSMNLDRAAILSQLWADTTYFYSKLRGVDPGSNPEVKNVRDRGASLLAAEAAGRRGVRTS